MNIIATGEFTTLCHCNLGYVLDNETTTPMFPMTGDCIDYHQLKCASNLAESKADQAERFCFEDDNEWGICPYCRAFKHHEDHGGILELGYYVSGEGNFETGEPMVFTGGSSTNCINPRSSEGYWYCWYDAYSEIVSLDYIELVWTEVPLCHYTVYIYTPLACDWAKPI